MAESPGSFSISYSIDEGPNSHLKFTFPGGDADWLHQRFIQTPPLSSGSHTIKVTLEETTGQSLKLDYILYTPSFATLSALPQLGSGSSSSLVGSETSSGGSKPTSSWFSASDSRPQQTADSEPPPTAVSTLVPSSHPSSTESPPKEASPSAKPPVGTIIGGVVGGLAALSDLLAAFLFWRQKQRRQDCLSEITGDASSSLPFRSPFRPDSTSFQRFPVPRNYLKLHREKSHRSA